MLQQGAWLVPTLQAPREVIAAADVGLPIPHGVGRQGARRSPRCTTRPCVAPTRRASGSRWAPTAGVGAHGTNLEEIELMIGAGLSPLEALHATTGSAAELLDVAARPGHASAPVCAPTSSWSTAAPTTSPTSGERVRAVWLDGAAVSGRGLRPPSARASTESWPRALPSWAWCSP